MLLVVHPSACSPKKIEDGNSKILHRADGSDERLEVIYNLCQQQLLAQNTFFQALSESAPLPSTLSRQLATVDLATAMEIVHRQPSIGDTQRQPSMQEASAPGMIPTPLLMSSSTIGKQ
jgi:hypothetical protein